MANWKYYIGPGTAMGLPQAETQKRIMATYGEMASMTAATFQRVERSANIWIYFKTAEQIKARWRGQGVPMAIHFGNQIWIVSDVDRFEPFNPARRLVEGVVWHETDHYFFGPYHSPDITDLSNINLLTTYPSTREAVNKWQRRHGVPSKVFFPAPQIAIGNEVRQLTARLDSERLARTMMITERNATMDKVKRAEFTKKIGVLTSQITATSNNISKKGAEWRSVNEAWKVVPMAGP